MNNRLRFGSAILFAASVLLSQASCKGPPKRPGLQLGGSAATGDSQSGSNENLSLKCSQESDPGEVPLRRLTRTQYVQSVKDLLGDLKSLETVLATQTQPTLGNTPSPVNSNDVETYRNAAEAIAAEFVKDKAKLTKVFNCQDSQNQSTCFKAATNKLVSRAFRTSESNVDLNAFLEVFTSGAKTSYEHGIELAVTLMLQHPRFIYLFEFGDESSASEKAVRLSPYELAGRLSLAIWDSVPDEELMRAAGAGELDTEAGLGVQINRMLASSRGKEMYIRFLNAWSGIEDVVHRSKDTEVFPEWQDENFRTSLKLQADEFFRDIVFTRGGTVKELLTSNSFPINKDIAKVYGGTSTSADFSGEFVEDSKRAGILSLPAFLAINGGSVESSPIKRGHFVRKEMLCQILPSPPSNIPEAPHVTPDSSTRERLNQHVSVANCKACHSLLDPPGLGLENFDAIGKFRDVDGGKPVDASGDLTNAKGIAGKFNGVIELSEKLSESDEVSECIARQWFRFLVSRFETSSDSCTVSNASKLFIQAGSDLRVLPKLIFSSQAFQYRQPVSGDK